jgi:hypothetical protein
MEPLESDAVLRDEANNVHHDKTLPDGTQFRDIPPAAVNAELYRALHARDASALCISGGGIRSATFALGVIEALAVHPRPDMQSGRTVATPDASLLSQFDYLSTVSGGGYIGSWLSAWIARQGYRNAWRNLVGRREHPDIESGETSWLRAYSNYLTPRLGLFSADTWTAIALYIRNLVLNWLVILSALVLALFAIKSFTAACLWIAGIVNDLGDLALKAFFFLGLVALIYALRFGLLNRPSRYLGSAVHNDDLAGGPSGSADVHHNERLHMAAGGDDRTFIKRCLLPALIASLLISLNLVIRGYDLGTWSLAQLVGVGVIFGFAVYAVAWLLAWPIGEDPARHRHGAARYWGRDALCWSIAGGVYGAGVGLGVYVVAHFKDLWFLLGYVNKANEGFRSDTGYFLIALIYGIPWILTAQMTAEMIFVGLTNWQPHSDADREWFGRSTGWFTSVAIIWFITTFLVLIAGDIVWAYLKAYDSAKYLSAASAAGSALFSTLLGKSGKSPATDQRDKSGLLMKLAVPAGAIVFLVMLLLAVSLLMDYLLFGKSLIDTALLGSAPLTDLADNVMWLLIGIAVAAFIATVAWTHVNINRFSIHALYRNRLIRAYLGASNADRHPNPFTGFDGADNVAMAKLWPPRHTGWQPFHIVNMALNVVNGKRLAWQERKAESFTASPLHCGTAQLGYRPTSEYGDRIRGGMSLGTAMAISGAAASPNMGYHSSPIVSLLLALFNVRLGWWLGNPGRPGNPHYYQKDGPRIAILPFIAEMFGLTTDDRHYVYLSDGGHFENLGLYEMIRRRCRTIVVSDAGCDPDFGFEDLGNAVRKIAIDLGISITFGKLHELKKRSKDGAVIQGAYYAIGKIEYRGAPEWNGGNAAPQDGTILYIKPGYHGTEGAGIVAYATANATFPHETTGDQFFSESQFESYRSLGFEIMDGVMTAAIERYNLVPKPPSLPGAPPPGAAHGPPTLRELIAQLAKM